MGKVEPVVSGISGMSQDYARELLPKGAMWSLLDVLPQAVGSNARSRNGWQVAGSMASPYEPIAGCFMEMPGGPTLFYVGSNPGAVETCHLFLFNGTDLGAVNRIKQNPFAHRLKMIIPHSGGTLPAKIVSEAAGVYTIGNLPASALTGRYGCAYKDRVVLANSAAQPTRVAFSPIGDPIHASPPATAPDGWDAPSWVDSTLPVAGLAGLRNSLLVFHAESMERIRGSLPPNTTTSNPTGDMILEAFPTRVGCFDARSIVYWRDHVIWADERGVHMTDGAATTNLAEAGGMQIPWRSLFDLSPTAIVAGLVGDFYIITMHLTDPAGFTYLDEAPDVPHVPSYPGGTGELMLTFLIDIPSRSWTRLSNFRANNYVTARLAGDEVITFGEAASQNMILASDAIYPTYQSTLTGTDGDGYDFRPIIETPWFPLSQGRDRIHNLWISYELRAPTDDAHVLVEVGTFLSADPPTFIYTLLPRHLPTHFEMKRMKIPIRMEAEGIAIRLTVEGAFSFFNLFAIEVETHAKSLVALGRA